MAIPFFMVNPKPQTPNPKIPKLQTPKPKPQTQTPNPKPDQKKSKSNQTKQDIVDLYDREVAAFGETAFLVYSLPLSLSLSLFLPLYVSLPLVPPLSLLTRVLFSCSPLPRSLSLSLSRTRSTTKKWPLSKSPPS